MSVSSPAELRRDCQCPRAKHQHGTTQAYVIDKCRCQDCRAANAARVGRYRKRKAYGRLSPKPINGIGARRRIQALATLGWSLRHLSLELGWSQDRLWLFLMERDGTNVSPKNHAKICALYDRLWDRVPPRTTKGERIVYTRTILRAKRYGWLPALAWDDIDDPDETPDYHTQPARRMTDAERLAEYGHLWASGVPEEQIAAKLGLSVGGLRKALDKALSAA